jgi:hypothetical protein
VFERSEFWPYARQSEQRSEAAGQHKGCPGVVRGMGTHSPDSTSSRNKFIKYQIGLNVPMPIVGFHCIQPNPQIFNQNSQLSFQENSYIKSD